MGCLHSKTAHLHSPEDPPTALPDSKKPDPGTLFTVQLFSDFSLSFPFWILTSFGLEVVCVCVFVLQCDVEYKLFVSLLFSENLG